MHKGQYRGQRRGLGSGLDSLNRPGLDHGLFNDKKRRRVSPYFIVGVVGDSNTRAFGATAGPTTLAGTCYEWNNTTGALVELTTAEVSTAANGSEWKQFALDHNARTGQKVVFVLGGVGGSAFYTNVAGGATNNWLPAPTGVLYEPFVAQMNRCLAFLGRRKPDLIAGNMGVNDEQGAVTLANFQFGVASLFDRLEADFPGVLKLWTQIGRYATQTNSSGLVTKRSALIDAIEARANFAMAASGHTYVFTTGYVADNVHYSTNSLNALGASYAKYLALTDIPNKWARGVVASLFTTPTPGRKATLVDFVTTLYNMHCYFTIGSCSFFCADTANNTVIDIAFMGANTMINGATLNPNNFIVTDGVNDYIGNAYTPSIYTRGGTQDDIFFIVKIKFNRTGSGTAAGLFGGGNSAAPFLGIAQNGLSQINYRVNDNTSSTYAGIGAFANNKFYGCARNGGTKYLLEGSSVLASASVASTGVSARDVSIGAWNTGGTLSAFINADHEFFMTGLFTNTDLSIILPKAQLVIDNP